MHKPFHIISPWKQFYFPQRVQANFHPKKLVLAQLTQNLLLQGIYGSKPNDITLSSWTFDKAALLSMINSQMKTFRMVGISIDGKSLRKACAPCYTSLKIYVSLPLPLHLETCCGLWVPSPFPKNCRTKKRSSVFTVVDLFIEKRCFPADFLLLFCATPSTLWQNILGLQIAPAVHITRNTSLQYFSSSSQYDLQKVSFRHVYKPLTPSFCIYSLLERNSRPTEETASEVLLLPASPTLYSEIHATQKNCRRHTWNLIWLTLRTHPEISLQAYRRPLRSSSGNVLRILQKFDVKIPENTQRELPETRCRPRETH